MGGGAGGGYLISNLVTAMVTHKRKWKWKTIKGMKQMKMNKKGQKRREGSG